MNKISLNFLSFLLLSFILTLFVCCKNSSYEQSYSNINAQNKEKRNKITGETAINIARGFLIFDYDFHYCDPIVTEQNDVWFVEFKPKKEYQNCPSAWIDKETGKILNIKIPK